MITTTHIPMTEGQWNQTATKMAMVTQATTTTGLQLQLLIIPVVTAVVMPLTLSALKAGDYQTPDPKKVVMSSLSYSMLMM